MSHLRPARLPALCLLLALLSGCGLIYKQNIQQGNAIEQEDLDELYIGMNQRQVLFVLGTPSIKDPFQQDRWDYVQTFSRRGGDIVQRTVTLRFEEGVLDEIIGQNDPFAAGSDDDSDALAAFVKPGTATGSGSTGESPQDIALESAEEEILNPEPDIEALEERSAEDREYRREQDILDQTPDDNPSGPDIDG
jgi:outer membrane protein assembly factor BamE (lipoprotein component of BamABCDE complex)